MSIYTVNNGSSIFGHIESIFLDWLTTFSSSIRIPQYNEEANKINDILIICEDFFQRREVVGSIIWKILQPILSLCYESSKNVWNLDSTEIVKMNVSHSQNWVNGFSWKILSSPANMDIFWLGPQYLSHPLNSSYNVCFIHL